jgi:hypothetical protein
MKKDDTAPAEAGGSRSVTQAPHSVDKPATTTPQPAARGNGSLPTHVAPPQIPQRERALAIDLEELRQSHKILDEELDRIRLDRDQLLAEIQRLKETEAAFREAIEKSTYFRIRRRIVRWLGRF